MAVRHALGDEYRLIRELGGGGMSQVFLAGETSLGRQVVVKVLPPAITSEASIARFRREAAVTARIQHPNILPVLAFGARAGLLYYVTPFLAGESLRHRIERTGPLPVDEAVQLTREVADAFAALAAVRAHLELARGDAAAAVRSLDAVPDSVCAFDLAPSC